MYRDWVEYINIEITNYKSIIDNIIRNNPPMYLDERLSTKGNNIIQYDLTSFKDQFLEIQEGVIRGMQRYMSNDFELVTAWTILGGENSYHKVHKHFDKPNHIATVLYLDNTSDSNHIQSGNFFCLMRDANGEIIYNEVNPTIGGLIIMPTHIHHGTYPQSTGLRHTLNMDFKVL